MLIVNTYTVTERAVTNGVNEGVSKLLEDVNNFSKPEIVINVITQAVMLQLCETFDFGVQPLRLTPDMMLRLAQTYQAEEPDEPQKS